MTEEFLLARYAASYKYPYFAKALFALIYHEVKVGELPMGSYAACDDRWNLYIEPQAFKKLSPHDRSGTLIHEIGHLLQGHSKRCSHRDKTLFNVAGDLEINDDFEGVVPDFCIFPEKEPFKFKPNLYAEEYYDLLLKKAPKKQTHCGSAATGEKQAYEVAGEGHLSDMEKEIIKKQVARDVLEHVKNKGSVPAGLKRWAEKLVLDFDPKKELSSAIRNCVNWTRGRTDYTYSKPSRRQYFYGNIIAPSMRSPIPSVVVCIDTSGSMSEKDLGMALGIVDKTLKSLNQSCKVITGDTQVEFVKKVTSFKEVDLLGGGGTDMGALVKAAEDLSPDLIIVVTDGYTDWCEKPKAKCVVALTQENKAPDWAKVVEVWRCVKE